MYMYIRVWWFLNLVLVHAIHVFFQLIDGILLSMACSEWEFWQKQQHQQLKPQMSFQIDEWNIFIRYAFYQVCLLMGIIYDVWLLHKLNVHEKNNVWLSAHVTDLVIGVCFTTVSYIHYAIFMYTIIITYVWTSSENLHVVGGKFEK